MISPQLVELALYSAYFPFNPSDIPSFDYNLELLLPTPYAVVTNDDVVKTKQIGNKTRHFFKSLQSSNDMPIVASPTLESVSKQLDGVSAEMFFTPAGKNLVAGKMEIMGDALKEFQKRFGGVNGKRVLRFAYSPRKGWGYSRLPLFVVSEQRAVDLLKKPFGREKDIKGNVHELAHFWWSIADTNTNNDWINEALAEYSALSFSVKKSNKDFRKEQIRQYIDDIQKAKTKEAIVDTLSESPDRYVNWYEKGALLLYVAELKYGKTNMNTFLTSFYSKFKGTRSANTGEFLDLLKKELGNDAHQLVTRFLTSKGWSDNDLKELERMIIL